MGYIGSEAAEAGSFCAESVVQGRPSPSNAHGKAFIEEQPGAARSCPRVSLHPSTAAYSPFPLKVHPQHFFPAVHCILHWLGSFLHPEINKQSEKNTACKLGIASHGNDDDGKCVWFSGWIWVSCGKLRPQSLHGASSRKTGEKAVNNFINNPLKSIEKTPNFYASVSISVESTHPHINHMIKILMIFMIDRILFGAHLDKQLDACRLYVRSFTLCKNITVAYGQKEE